MRSLLVALPGLGCVAMMVGMMWFMSRGSKRDRDASPGAPPPNSGAQISDLRAEVDRLRAELRAEQRESDPIP